MNDGFYNQQEILSLGFMKVGKNIKISKKSSFYLTDKISIGDNVRIDDFCLLVGNISIKNHVHIGAYCGLHASLGSITLENFSTISSNVTVYASTDDYSGKSMTNAVIDKRFSNIELGDVLLDRFCIIGTGTTILHKARIGEGVSVGAMSLVNSILTSWKLYAGVPCKFIKDKERKPLEMFKDFLRVYEQ